MPIYEYKCPDCQITVEILQKIGGSSSLCPKCGGKIIRIMSLPAIVGEKPGYAPRRKWAENWTPESKPIKPASVHGEHK